VQLDQETTSSIGFKIDLRKSNQRWSVATRLHRVMWNVTWAILFRPTPKRIGNPWRIWLLKLFGAKIDGTPLVCASCRILQPWELQIGACSAIGGQVEIYNYAKVSIGPMSVVSQYTYLCTGTHDYTHPHMPLIWAPITIGAECWIAAGAFVAPGIQIDDGVVVGARSVVTQHLPAWTVCAGNPCRPIKLRVVNTPI
jgi:putative colanic acid biosynthesis acetyltransferase WcaF